jgi:hypothetical protein
MRRVVAIVGAALVLLGPLPAAPQDNSQDGQAGMGTPRDGFQHLTDGEPRRRPGEALRRDRFDEAVEDLFESADSDRDGLVTLVELRGVIDARKVEAIRSRFAGIDADRSQSLSFAEFDQWQRGLGSVVLSDEGAAAASNIVVAEDVRPEPMRGPGGQVLARLIEPLNATMLTAANTNYDAGASLAEILAHEGKRFVAADVNVDGWVTADELAQALSKES